METKPVRRQATPRYPTRLEVLADGTLLEKHMPAAWKNCAEMAGAVAILLSVNGCLAQAQKPEPGENTTAAVVAPIFVHGEGRGATGCVVVNAPVFLSEQDAMQVIREELQKSGIALTEQNVKLSDVSISSQQEIWGEKNGELDINTQPTGETKPLVLQALDPKKRVGVEIVHARDYEDLGGGRSGSTVQGYDFKRVAEEVRKRVASKGRNLYFGTFYDPMAALGREREDPVFSKKISALYSEYEKATDQAAKQKKEAEIDALYQARLDPLKNESRRLLRMQVKDFIDWLKGQGVI